MRRRLPAYQVYLIISGAFAALFTMMSFISAIYRVQAAGLNPLQLVLLGTALELATFTFEIPTGILADVYSRRLSVIVGYAVIGAGFMLEGALTNFTTILLAQVVWGIGYTFISGAQDAWLADEIGEERLTAAYLQGSQLRRAGSLLGIAGSIALGHVALGLPIFVAGILLLGLSLFLLLVMPETGFQPTPRHQRNSWQKMGDTFREGMQVVRGRRILVLILVIALFFGLSSEGLDRLWAAHLLEDFNFPAVGSQLIWFGLISVSNLLLGLAVTEAIRRYLPVANPRVTLWTQLTLTAFTAVSIAVFAVAVRFPLAVAAIVAVQVLRSATAPLFGAWINRQLERRTRATVLSVSAQFDALGQIVGGPPVGALATAVSLRAALLAVAGLFLPITGLFRLALRWTAADTEVDPKLADPAGGA